MLFSRPPARPAERAADSVGIESRPEKPTPRSLVPATDGPIAGGEMLLFHFILLFCPHAKLLRLHEGLPATCRMTLCSLSQRIS